MVNRLACPACGAGLPLPAEGVTTLTCRHCGSTLQVQQHGPALTLTVVQQVAHTAGQEVGRQVRAQWQQDLAPMQQAITEQELRSAEQHAAHLRTQAALLRTSGTWADYQQARQDAAAATANAQALRQRLYPNTPPPAPTIPQWAGWQLMLGLFLLAVLILWLAAH